MSRPASLKGFTLIELLIVIVIIGILSAGAVALFTGAQARARDARRKSDLNAIELAIQQAMNTETNQAPLYAAGIMNTAAPAGLVGTGLQKAVAPPQTSEIYCYGYTTLGAAAPWGGDDKYALVSFLENAEGTPAANVFVKGALSAADLTAFADAAAARAAFTAATCAGITDTAGLYTFVAVN